MAMAKSLSKLAPDSGGKAKNISSTVRLAASGSGFDTIMRVIDNTLLGGFVQRFSINARVVSVSLIDVANFMAHNKGSIVPKTTAPFIAVGSAKLVQGAVNTSGLSVFKRAKSSGENRSAPGESSGAQGGGL